MKIRATLVCGLVLGAFAVSPAPGDYNVIYKNPEGYAYYDVWWREYQSDPETKLLLHFNQPRPPAWARPGNAKLGLNEREEDGLGNVLETMDGGGLGGGGLGGMQDGQMDSIEHKAGRPRTERAPKGKVYDYSPNQAAAVLPDGVQKVDDGRLGRALRLTGETGLKIVLGEKGGGHVMEGWFKPDALPDQPVCLLASRTDGGRLLLHPDGRIEVRRPAGERKELVSIKSDRPIKPGRWTHVAAYLFKFKHIEGGRGRRMELRLGFNADVVARKPGKFGIPGNWAHGFTLAERGLFYIGMNPDGEQVYQGLVDQVRVASRRRYNKRDDLSWRDPHAQRDVPFGPPHFKKDARVFHASFESRKMTVHPPGQPRIKWNLGEHADFEDMQAPGVYGKAVVIDPAFGPLRIPIQGFSPKEGTFELWFQPVNWDNHTDYGKRGPPDQRITLARFMGRDTKTGKIVPFMTFQTRRAVIHGIADWFHPGQWSHLIWSWSPQDVYKEKQPWGGGADKGDPLGGFKGYREGELIWRAQLNRDTDLLDRIEPLYLELGIQKDITVRYDQRPTIMVDEVIGHSDKFSREQINKAPKRWKGELSSE